MAVNPTSYKLRSENNWPISYEMGSRKVAGDFPDLEGFLYANKIARSTPGKTLDFDFVIYPSPGAFDQGKELCSVYMDFYHITEGWHRTVTICDNWQIKIQTYSAKEAWGKSPKPLYGWRAYNGGIVSPNGYLSSSELSSVTSMSYSSMNSLLFSKGLQTVNTNGFAGGQLVTGTQSFPHFEPFGVRYLSNKGNYSAKRAHNPGVNASLKFVKYTSKADGGAGALIRIDQPSYAGETKYRLRFVIGRKQWEFFRDVNGLMDIDNALLGIPDYQQGTSQQDWPPRYDAKFYVADNGWHEAVAAGKISDGSGWKVF